MTASGDLDLDLGPVERLARRCEIYIEETYNVSGSEVLGTKAKAVVDNKTLCEVTIERCDTPQKLGELLESLGVMIGVNALARST